MSIKALKERLDRKSIGGLYLFYGDDEYTKDYYAEALKKLVKYAEFNYKLFDAATIDLDELAEEIDTPPSMSPFRMIVIRNLAIEKGKNKIQELLSVLSDIPDDICVLLLFRKEKIKKPVKDSDDNLISYATKNGVCVEFTTSTSDSVCNWIVRHLRAAGVTYESNLDRFIYKYCGGDLYVLHGEIQKLVSYYNGAPLTQRDVINVCIPDISFKVWELCDSIMKRNLKKSEQILAALINDKVAPVVILSQIGGIFTDIFYAKSASASNRNELKSLVKAPAWKVNEIISTAIKTNDEFLTFAMNEILAVNRAVISTNIPPYELIRILIYKLQSH